MTQTDISYEHLINREVMEDMSCSLSLALRKQDTDSEFCVDLYGRQLVPFKSDEDSEESCQENHQRSHALFSLDFGEDKSCDLFPASEGIKLFGQLHRISEGLSLQFDFPALQPLDGSISRHQSAYEDEDSCRRIDCEAKQSQILPIASFTTCRRPLPMLPFEKTPVYVNSKQYDRILKLRTKKLEEGRIRGPNYVFERPKSKTYRHESRSQHAKGRKRGENGRFLTKRELEALEMDMIEDKTHLCPKIKKRET